MPCVQVAEGGLSRKLKGFRLTIAHVLLLALFGWMT